MFFIPPANKRTAAWQQSQLCVSFLLQEVGAADSHPPTSSPSLGFHEGEWRLRGTPPPTPPSSHRVGGPWASPRARRPPATFPQLLAWRPCRVARPRLQEAGFKSPGRKQQQPHQFRDWRVGVVKMSAVDVIPGNLWLLRESTRVSNSETRRPASPESNSQPLDSEETQRESCSTSHLFRHVLLQAGSSASR